MTFRLDDPPLIQENAPATDADALAPYAGARDQARLYLVFLSELEAGGLSHAEALWFAAQVWRAA